MAMTDEQIERYSRHIILKEVGAKGQKKLLKGKVLIIGAGGLGAPAAMYLAAAGVGTIGIVDADEVDLSNLQRQIIHSTADIGKAKVKSAKETMNAMNPDVKVKTYRMFVDASNIRELIREHLQYAGYVCEEAGDVSAALSLLCGGGFDLVILDVMMPFMDGMTCLREMRARHINTPVIILTARGEEYDKLAGLEGGADDYVVKPFSPRELVARVKAVLNRTMPRSEASDGTMTFGELTIDTASHTVRVAGEDVSLTPKEFDLLVFLASNKGIALSREKILQKVWNYDYFGEDRTVDTHVKMLRGHLGKCRGYIATVWGIGYKFDPDAAR